MEEKVLHAVSGTVLVDERTNQLHWIEGKIPADVNLGYGLLGTVLLKRLAGMNTWCIANSNGCPTALAWQTRWRCWCGKSVC
jgi:hypothetical protein